MAFFVKRTSTGTDAAPLFTLSQQKNLLIVGLGNVGTEYDGTRHNLGFMCVEAFATQHDFPAWTEKKDLKCRMTSQTIGDTRVIIIKPTTFMNLSGDAVQAVQHFYKIGNDSTVVVHDELDIPFGEIRTKVGGGSAGHNGLKSVIARSGEDFGRIRIGIKNDLLGRIDSADFVLAKLSKAEQEQLPLMVREVSGMLDERVAAGNLSPTTRNFI